MEPIKIGGWTITYNPKPIPVRNYDYDFQHDEFYGDCDSHNGLAGAAKSTNDALMQIIEIQDEIISETESTSPRQDQWESVEDSLPQIGQWVNVLEDLDTPYFDGSMFKMLNPNKPIKSVTCAKLHMIDEEGWGCWCQCILADGQRIGELNYVTHWQPLPKPKP